jgi:hypothetical protein
MQMQSRKLMLASGIALASISGLAFTGSANAGTITLPVAPNLVSTLSLLTGIAPSLVFTLAPTLALAPTTTVSPTFAIPVLSTLSLPALPGLGAL